MKLNLIENVESKWDLFNFLVECPTCGDRGGHAGLYNHPINPSLPGIFGYCVICEVSFRDDDNYNEVKHELKQMGFSPSHIHSINPSAKINKKAVHKTAMAYTG